MTVICVARRWLAWDDGYDSLIVHGWLQSRHSILSRLRLTNQVSGILFLWFRGFCVFPRSLKSLMKRWKLGMRSVGFRRIWRLLGCCCGVGCGIEVLVYWMVAGLTNVVGVVGLLQAVGWRCSWVAVETWRLVWKWWLLLLSWCEGWRYRLNYRFGRS